MNYTLLELNKKRVLLQPTPLLEWFSKHRYSTLYLINFKTPFGNFLLRVHCNIFQTDIMFLRQFVI